MSLFMHLIQTPSVKQYLSLYRARGNHLFGNHVSGHRPSGSPLSTDQRRVNSSVSFITGKSQCAPLVQCGQFRRRQSGFTLVEIAIVLVIVGLILGGVMKGQALIDNARVRSLATDVSGIQTAWYSFQDRYRSYPGDFPNAAAQIDSAAKPGNGNGKIDDDQERASVWQQLSLAGFIAGNFDGRGSAAGTATDVDCNKSTCPQNPFNGFYKVSYGAQAENAGGPANEIFTGDQIPVNILAQLDIRLDDGEPDSGRFRVHRAFTQNCTRNGQWDVANGHANCAGVLRE